MFKSQVTYITNSLPVGRLTRPEQEYLERAITEMLRQAYRQGQKSRDSWGSPQYSEQELRGIQGIYG